MRVTLLVHQPGLVQMVGMVICGAQNPPWLAASPWVWKANLPHPQPAWREAFLATLLALHACRYFWFIYDLFQSDGLNPKTPCIRLQQDILYMSETSYWCVRSWKRNASWSDTSKRLCHLRHVTTGCTIDKRHLVHYSFNSFCGLPQTSFMIILLEKVHLEIVMQQRLPHAQWATRPCMKRIFYVRPMDLQCSTWFLEPCSFGCDTVS